MAQARTWKIFILILTLHPYQGIETLQTPIGITFQMNTGILAGRRGFNQNDLWEAHTKITRFQRRKVGKYWMTTMTDNLIWKLLEAPPFGIPR